MIMRMQQNYQYANQYPNTGGIFTIPHRNFAIDIEEPPPKYEEVVRNAAAHLNLPNQSQTAQPQPPPSPPPLMLPTPTQT